MKLSANIIELLELYVSNKASKKQRAEVDALVQNNSEISKLLQAMQLLKTELINLEVTKAQQQLLALRQKIAAQASKQPSSLAQRLKQTTQYSLQQLQKLFAPQAIYKQHIDEFSLRAAGFSLLQPKQDLDCQNHQLHFELQAPVYSNEEIEIIIEDNQNTEKLYQEYSNKQTSFTVHLPPQDFTTGRYYWKFSFEDQIIIGSFFINKHLMPKA